MLGRGSPGAPLAPCAGRPGPGVPLRPRGAGLGSGGRAVGLLVSGALSAAVAQVRPPGPAAGWSLSF